MSYEKVVGSAEGDGGGFWKDARRTGKEILLDGLAEFFSYKPRPERGCLLGVFSIFIQKI